MRTVAALIVLVLAVLVSASVVRAQTPAPSVHPGAGVPDPAGRIAFGRIVEHDDFYGQVVALYAIDPDGSDLVQLTEGGSAFPAWSPDGGRLAFTQRQPDGSWQIATVAADGSDARVLTTGDGVSEAPSWSPDGSWIAYDFAPTFPTDDTWHTTLYRIDADGSDPTLLGDPRTFDVEPQIAPDGRHVAFMRLAFDDAGQHSLLVIREIESGAERVLDAAGDAVEHAKWSPDGRWLIYAVGSSMTGGGGDQIERIAADGESEPEVLYAGTDTQSGAKPAYSPDGQRIVFGCGGGGGGALCLANADGSGVLRLVDDPAAEENHFSWGVAGE